MEREVSESDLETNVSRVLAEVSQRPMLYVVLRDGRPAAAIVPYEQPQNSQQSRRYLVRRGGNCGSSPG